MVWQPPRSPTQHHPAGPPDNAAYPTTVSATTSSRCAAAPRSALPSRRPGPRCLSCCSPQPSQFRRRDAMTVSSQSPLTTPRRMTQCPWSLARHRRTSSKATSTWPPSVGTCAATTSSRCCGGSGRQSKSTTRSPRRWPRLLPPSQEQWQPACKGLQSERVCCRPPRPLQSLQPCQEASSTAP